MKILLNGATGGTNFGDFLFARIFHDSVSEIVGEENVIWYDSRYCLSKFYKRHLKCRSRKHRLNDVDALICISGGYFCGNDKSLRDYIFRYLRYFHLCVRCIRKKIPIAIIGLEVAESKMKIMNWVQRYILQSAEVVVVRNEESFEQLKRYGVKNPICTADTAHVITPSMFENCVVQEEILALKGKKLFFHVQASGVSTAKKLVPVVDRFVAAHPEYSIVIGGDQYLEDDNILIELAKEFSYSNVVINHYDDPMELCKVLDEMDLIITPKLHVGIVGATLSKSVVSFSIHTEKIARFYHQIGEDDRSLSMKDFSEEKAFQMLEKYHETPVCVEKDIIEAAKSNLLYLEKFVKEHSAKGK